MTEPLCLTELHETSPGLRRLAHSLTTSGSWRRLAHRVLLLTSEMVRALPHDAARLFSRRGSRLVRVEDGTETFVQATRIALYVHYSPNGQVSDMVRYQLGLLRDAGFATVFISMAKTLPEADWQAVFDLLTERGLHLKLLAGNQQEAERAQALLEGRAQAVVLPRGSLTETAQVLAAAQLMVGLDSGLTHLSAALGRPTIGIYKASTPVRTPLVSSAFTASLGDRGQAPSRQMVFAAIEQALR